MSLTNHDFQWGRSEVVIIYPDLWEPWCLWQSHGRRFPVAQLPVAASVFGPHALRSVCTASQNLPTAEWGPRVNREVGEFTTPITSWLTGGYNGIFLAITTKKIMK